MGRPGRRISFCVKFTESTRTVTLIIAMATDVPRVLAVVPDKIRNWIMREPEIGDTARDPMEFWDECVTLSHGG